MATTCGDFVIEVTNPDPDIFDISLPVQTDGSEPAEITAKQTSDTSKVSLVSPYRSTYQFGLTVKLLNWQQVGDVVYEYDIAADNGQSSHLSFLVRDYCLGVTYSEPLLIIDDDSELVVYVSEPGNLVMAKQILT